MCASDISFSRGRAIGWVHATTAELGIQEVCKVTEHAAEDCTALPLNAGKDRGGCFIFWPLEVSAKWYGSGMVPRKGRGEGGRYDGS